MVQAICTRLERAFTHRRRLFFVGLRDFTLRYQPACAFQSVVVVVVVGNIAITLYIELEPPALSAGINHSLAASLQLATRRWLAEV